MALQTQRAWDFGQGELARHGAVVVMIAGLVLAAMMILHDMDHIRQALAWNYSIPPRLVAVVLLTYLPNALAFYLAMKRNRWAALVTPVAGALVLAEYTIVHLIDGPAFLGPWATPFPRLRVDAITWTILGLTLAGALIAIASGPLALRERSSH